MTEMIEQLLAFWFGELDERGMSSAQNSKLWFTLSHETDERCRRRFGTWVTAALGGELDAWSDLDRGLVALVLLLDQLPRNIYRGTAQAFAGDRQALSLAQEAINSGRYRRLPAIHQVFLYMPLEHCEDLEVQQECVAVFTALADITGDASIAEFTRYAQAHCDVIAQFGRFPHRNAILGRESTAREIEYLADHGGF